MTRPTRRRCEGTRDDGSRCQGTAVTLAPEPATCRKHGAFERPSITNAVDPADLPHPGSGRLVAQRAVRKRARRAEAAALSVPLVDDDLPGVIQGLRGAFPGVEFVAVAEVSEAPEQAAPLVGPLSLPGLDAAPRGARLPDARVRQREMGQFFTPPWLAAEVARIAEVEGRRVLEPSAGDGSIVAACLDAGAEAVLAVEKDPRMVAKLRKRFAGKPVDIIEGDFLSVAIDPRCFDVIAGNPPYDHGADGDHLSRMIDLMKEATELSYVRGYGYTDCRAVLVLRTVVLHSQDRHDRVWSRAEVKALYPVADRVAFEIDGRIAEAGKIDVSIFVLQAGAGDDESAVRHVRAPVSLNSAVAT